MDFIAVVVITVVAVILLLGWGLMFGRIIWHYWKE